MELKKYQIATLNTFSRWLDALNTAKVESKKSIAVLQGVGLDIPGDVRNYPKAAWKKLKDSSDLPETAGAYVDRTDDAGCPIPHVCFKVPTGGGKTLLAAAALERLNRQTGLVLWITPTNAIYGQTKAALRNREHPYRQMLERASGGRVKFMEKDYPLTALDVHNYLCVMLLSLPATNRNKNRDFLRMFRDSGRYPTLFPDGDDVLGDARLLNTYPDLERTSNDGPAKQSLLNVFKTLRPVVVLDEAHKAYGSSQNSAQEFANTVSRLGPSLVIELSATPNRGISNLLVDITGVELQAEEMIKLPVQVTAVTYPEWQYTLGEAHKELEQLEEDARAFEENGRYIRPIAVVRVERTGKDQRDGEWVHAYDVRDYLMQSLSVPENQVAIKSSELDQLGRDNLLSEDSPVRWIITKSALMEGWDCPFAYLLVMLDNTQAQRAITQLVGRVMRQPHARRTGVERLDQCYVYCWKTDVGIAIDQVKNGLEQEGLTGLGDQVFGRGSPVQPVLIRRADQHRDKNIFLPMVLHRDGDDYIELDWRRHIRPEINWDAIDVPPGIQEAQANPARIERATVGVGSDLPVYHPSQLLNIDKPVNIAWFTRRLSDIVTNPWRAARFVMRMVDVLRANGKTDMQINDRSYDLVCALQEHIKAEVDKQAKRVFVDKLRRGEISFDLKAGRPHYEMVSDWTISVTVDEKTLQNYGQGMQLSLFKPIFACQFDSDLERNFARYLDEQMAIEWWHRVAARQRGDYYLRGWRQDRIYPDFLAIANDTDGSQRILMIETKGEHLRGNHDTEYKKRVMKVLQDAYNHQGGTMTIEDGPAKGTFRLIFSEAEFPTALAT